MEVFESNPVGHLATLLAATDDDGDTLFCDIIDGNINFDFLISRDKGSLIFTKHLNLEWKAGYKFSTLEFHDKVSENISPGSQIIKLNLTDSGKARKYFIFFIQLKISLLYLRLRQIQWMEP